MTTTPTGRPIRTLTDYDGKGLHIRSTTDAPLVVRLVERGPGWQGPEDDVIVGFYDERYPVTQVDVETRGQLVADYYATTLVDEDDGLTFGEERRYPDGLSLDTREPEWTVPAAAMDEVVAWIEAHTTLGTW